MKPTVKIDMTGLNRGFNLAMEFSKRKPGVAANTAAYFIAVDAQLRTNSVQIPTIDLELDVAVYQVLGKRGKPLKGKRNRRFATTPSNSAPLAALIIQASVNSSSKYNQLTGFKYYRTASPFKGVSRAAGAAAMAQAIHNLIAKRHGATSYLRAGWSKAIDILFPLSSSKYVRGIRGRASGVFTYGADLGTAQPAPANSFLATCLIENDVGLTGKNAVSHNRALMEFGAPALQAAVDNEGKNQMQYFLDHAGRAELEIPVNKAWS